MMPKMFVAEQGKQLTFFSRFSVFSLAHRCLWAFESKDVSIIKFKPS